MWKGLAHQFLSNLAILRVQASVALDDLKGFCMFFAFVAYIGCGAAYFFFISIVTPFCGSGGKYLAPTDNV
jgi:hypothetical protein